MQIVAVSQRVDVLPERRETRDALDQRLAMFVAACGGLTAPIPNVLSEGSDLNQWLDAVQPDAIVLSGGNDIGQCPGRDITERRLLDYAEALRLPVLGICRGMQMMGVWAGGKLRPVEGHAGTRHQLTGGVTGEVNSYHHHALISCPPDFVVLARSEDGGIEAIHHETLPWQGWMWHPEREASFSIRDIDRVRNLFK